MPHPYKDGAPDGASPPRRPEHALEAQSIPAQRSALGNRPLITFWRPERAQLGKGVKPLLRSEKGSTRKGVHP